VSRARRTHEASKAGPKVFISHASEDAELAKRLADELKRKGFTPWVAAENVHPGENFAKALGDAMGSSDAIVVLVSPAFMSSPYLLQEWNFAIGSKKHAGRVLPVLTPGTDTDQAPWILKHIQHLKAGSDWRKTSQRVAETLKQIGRAA
jgi:hypothetical protein